MITPERVNAAIDKGWRLVEIPNFIGNWCLVPPEGAELTLGYVNDGVNVFNLVVPSKKLDDWLKARVSYEPDDAKRVDLKAKVQKWYHAEWDNYVRECEGDAEYAASILVDDAIVDHGISSDDADAWLEEVRNARGC